VGGLRGQQLLPPPITFKRNRDGIHIVLDKSWLELAKYYFVSVRLPLPRDAATQNAVLMLLTSTYSLKRCGDFPWRFLPARRRRKFCRSIGINHRTRNATLRNVIFSAGEWFKNQHMELEWIEHDKKLISFCIRKPSDVRTSFWIREMEREDGCLTDIEEDLADDDLTEQRRQPWRKQRRETAMTDSGL
jgi:hypothetical protein